MASFQIQFTWYTSDFVNMPTKAIIAASIDPVHHPFWHCAIVHTLTRSLLRGIELDYWSSVPWKEGYLDSFDSKHLKDEECCYPSPPPSLFHFGSTISSDCDQVSKWVLRTCTGCKCGQYGILLQMPWRRCQGLQEKLQTATCLRCTEQWPQGLLWSLLHHLFKFQ